MKTHGGKHKVASKIGEYCQDKPNINTQGLHLLKDNPPVDTESSNQLITDKRGFPISKVSRVIDTRIITQDNPDLRKGLTDLQCCRVSTTGHIFQTSVSVKAHTNQVDSPVMSRSELSPSEQELQQALTLAAYKDRQQAQREELRRCSLVPVWRVRLNNFAGIC